MELTGSRAGRGIGIAALVAAALGAGAASAGAEVSDEPQIAVDQGGNAFIVWRTTDGADRVKTRKRNADGTLGAVQGVSAKGQDAGQAQVATDPAGNAYYVWTRRDGSDFIVQTRVREADGNLTAVQDLSDPGESATQPEVAVDALGNADYTWIRSNGSHNIVQGRRRTADGTLGPVQDLSGAGRNAGRPQVGVDPAGDAYFVWDRDNGTNFVIQYRRWAADGTLGSVQGLSAAGQNAFEAQVAVDAQGGVSFAWQRSDGTNEIAQTRRRLPGGGLSAVQDLSAAGQDGFDVQVGVDPKGNATYVWQRANVIQTRRRRAADGTLSAVQDLATTGGTSEPQIAVDPTGTASYTWSKTFSFGSVVQTRRRTAEGLLNPTQGLSFPGESGDDEQLALDPQGDAYFAWTRAGIIQTRVRETDGTVSAVQDVTN